MSKGHYFTFGIFRIFHWQNTLVGSSHYQNFAAASFLLPVDRKKARRSVLFSVKFGFGE